MNLRSAAVPCAGYALACIWPGAQFVASNQAHIAWMGGEGTLVVLLLCTTLWLTGCGVAFVPAQFACRWSAARALSVCTVAVFVLFTQAAVRAWLLGSWSLDGPAARVASVVITAAALLLVWRLSAFELVRVTLAIAATLIAAVPLGKVAAMGVAIARAPSGVGQVPPSTASAPALSGENVYYVVLDSYAGPAALKQYLGVDLDPFLGQLRALGYYSADSARANYMTTQVSVMAALEMRYIVDENSPSYREGNNLFPYALARDPGPTIVRRMRASGYDFFHVGNDFVPCRPQAGVRCLKSASRYGFYRYVADVFLAPTKIPGAIRARSGRRLEYDAIAPLSRAMDDLTAGGRPFFVFAHHMSPHSPFRRADCSDQIAPGDALVTRQHYRETIACVNTTVLALLRRIKAMDPNAIVVLQGDHGSGFEGDWTRSPGRWSYPAIDELSSVINLVRVPEACRQWVRPTLSPITTMRLVVGCLERRAPDYLEDLTYITTYPSNADFGFAFDVTGRLRERR